MNQRLGDDQGFSYEQWRENWRKGGMKWSSKQPPPRDWNAGKQLEKMKGKSAPTAKDRANRAGKKG
jgi:hypothetical protein